MWCDVLVQKLPCRSAMRDWLVWSCGRWRRDWTWPMSRSWCRRSGSRCHGDWRRCGCRLYSRKMLCAARNCWIGACCCLRWWIWVGEVWVHSARCALLYISHGSLDLVLSTDLRRFLLHLHIRIRVRSAVGYLIGHVERRSMLSDF